MCGIIGYTGERDASPILIAGLRRLEYRGYDSAGAATCRQGMIDIRKRAGRVHVLEELIDREPLPGVHGISHTRWATHGPATDANAHPHLGGRSQAEVAIVHNGVIENHTALRGELERAGFRFMSETDSEVIAHLIAQALEEEHDLFEAVKRILPRLEGTYGLVAISPAHPGVLIGARMGSPLLVGMGEGEQILASDASAVAPHTRQVVYLQDGEVARLTPSGFDLVHRDRGVVAPRVDRIDWRPDAAELGRHAHYMIKEIREQPATLVDACRGRINRRDATACFGGLNLTPRALRRVRRVVLIGCGTSWHAALVGEYLIERIAHLPVEVEFASEFRYRNAPLDDRTLVFVLSQSGETADALGALREANRLGHPTLAIVNTVGSTIAREAMGGVYLHAGIEVGVASTKAFTAQIAVLTLLALHLGRLRGLSFQEGLAIVEALEEAPGLMQDTLNLEPLANQAAEPIAQARSVLFLGRDLLYPVALEGALKLTEVTYIPAHGYAAAEMKHGPIALVDETTPCVFLAPRCSLYAKTVSTIEEVRARGGIVVAIGTEGDRVLPGLASIFLPIPDAPEVIQPFLCVVPLQMLAYHVGLRLGRDIDKPRNLAKSVTVE